MLLIVSGIAGILLPGPVGTPLLILGCVIVWPKAFNRVNLFFASPVSPGASPCAASELAFPERPRAAVSHLQVTMLSSSRRVCRSEMPAVELLDPPLDSSSIGWPRLRVCVVLARNPEGHARSGAR